MNKAKKNIITLIEVIAIIILTLVIFSNAAKALNLNDITSVNSIGELAYFIDKNPNGFMATPTDQIFSLNNKKSGTIKGLTTASYNGSQAIYYKSALCLYHSQAGIADDHYRAKIVNIVDIETPGILTVYGLNGAVGTVNVAESEEAARYIYLNKFRTFAGSEKNFNFTKIKSEVSAFTYLVYQNTLYGEHVNSDSYNPIREDSIGYWWMRVADYQIKRYVWASGVMDSALYSGDQQFGIGGSTADENLRTEMRNAVANILENPSLAKNSTVPNVEYQNGKAYIGPLQASFTGGTPTLTVAGTTATWATKNTNGTYAEPNGTVPSGQVVYAVISESVVKNLSNVNVKLTLNWTKYKARLVLTKNVVATGQNLVFLAGKEESGSTSIGWSIEQSKQITIQKQDVNGNNLSVAGIEFKVYNSAGQVVGTLTTNGSGRTNALTVNANTQYTIRETKNSAYGYKGSVISGAQLVSGSGSVSAGSGQVTISVSADSVIGIRNQPQLGSLTIHKTGNGNANLSDVQFVLWKGDAYLKLDNASVTTPIVTPSGGLDITRYNVTTVSTASQATKFKTDSSGKIKINNLEIYAAKDTKYNYWLQEISNSNYGYKAMAISNSDVSVTGGSKLEVRPNTREVKFDISSGTTVKINNARQLGHIQIQKVGKDGTALPNVEFVIQRGTNEYIQLRGVSGPIKTTVSLLNYTINYVTDKNSATRFVTGADGKITIKDFEVNASTTQKYTYTVHEVKNPNHGYGSATNTSLKGTATLSLNGTTTIKLSNTQELGNLELTKYGQITGNTNNHKITLPNVGFVIQATPALNAKYGYIALYKNGKIEPSVPETATVNSKNVSGGSQYELRYYETDKEYSALTKDEKDKITTFITGANGKLTVNNLEVYSQKTGQKYTYKLIETSNANYGYKTDVELGGIQLTSNTTAKKEITNEQIYTKISGYVWEEKSDAKSNLYDYLYNNANSKVDVKFTDLYKTQNGKVVKNPDAVVPVEIKLRNKATGAFVKTQPDQFGADGKYTFTEVEIANLANYKIVFEYNGFKYTTTIPSLDKDNGSKVKEVQAQRTDLNNKFGEVKENGQVVSADGRETNKVEYRNGNHSSTVSKLNFNTTVRANTTETNLNLKNKFNTLEGNSSTTVDEIQNINMGIVLREQPKLAIGSDIHSVSVEVNGKNYDYYYNGRQNHYENLNGDEVGVKFEQETALNRYTRTVYSSDVEALKDNRTTMNVSIIYKIKIMNQSRTLTSVVNEITNYFDGDYSIEAIGSNIEKTAISNPLNFRNGEVTGGVNVKGAEDPNKTYSSTKITLGEGLNLKAGENKDLYIKFSISQDAIKELLDGKSTYHNATEITNYSTFYGATTGKDSNNAYFVTEQRTAGEIYAGIDKSSQPGNVQLELIKDARDQGKTLILNTASYEDDSTSAPAFILEATESRKISGMIWDDLAPLNEQTEERLGNGIYDQYEKPVQNVQVALHQIDENGNIGEVAKYSNGVNVVTTTDADGKYTLGYFDNANKEHVGILPGKYVIKYTYNGETYVVGKENIDPNSYKSTIIKSEVIKNAFDGSNKNERWYLVQEGNRYSDARDDISLRPEYKEGTANSVTNATYESLLIDQMNAYTPTMNIGVEFTATDETMDAQTATIIKELTKVDFGIVERPKVNIEIEKEITGLEIVAQNGSAIIPKGDPTDTNARMQYVKKLDGIVSAEIEAKLLQGAKLNIEYTVKVINNSDMDYLESEYYYYGTGGVTEKTARAATVVDYLDDTMSLDTEKNQAIWTETTADDLYKEGNGFISKEVYDELKKGDYHILVTDAFEDVGMGNGKTVTLHTTRALAVSDSIREENKVEIIEVSGKRAIENSRPGNYEPSKSANDPYNPDELDDDGVDLVITPPTGTTVNYVIYIVAGIATFAILVLGIVIIKKKIIK